MCKKMSEEDIEQFCWENRINRSGDSYYFTLNGRRYRVSNHSLWERRNKNARIERCYNIIAQPDCIEDIYTALKYGKYVDARGNIVL